MIQDTVRNTVVGDMLENRVCMEKDRIEVNIGVRLSQAEYFRLRENIARISRSYVVYGVKGVALNEFMRKKMKGCGKLRKAVQTKNSKWYIENNPSELQIVRGFWGEGEINIARETIELNLGIWTMGRLEASFKNFLFNMAQGRMYLNSALAHFTEELPGCTFCTIEAKRELMERNITEERPEYLYYLNLVTPETKNHIFWDCPFTRPIIETAYRVATEGERERVGGGGDCCPNKRAFFWGTI